MCKSVSKGEGLRFAAVTMGVPLADTVAIGDSDNDLTMIEAAGIGIAMGNGEQCAKDAADWVTDAVDASGLARAFERLGVV
ncbi:HAD family hydrolase [Bifidobacterium bifidum]|uniref:HAD hydrolase family protein n=1 Tax=Bifidobacterium bifidum TaxID=1681 RepID=A0A7J5TPS9_BIFBI|nr:HAD hydrolase family protein [Bifidobacterium bifidum]KAB5602562.1 HAD hydrolase family protein [Bifidobacterium bifidum]KAB5604241.1 HAD hydrolase family protein [Bifidobacterium bifidum]KAB7467129.1 HAD hydrolase family protein [Bifidobacterium bifidum]KAB7471760.1 HAD hydrolase family protein [Bifidobacterium bifidum]KAB7472164.1 HAD hydrolase family protein [Bifidobacterium bifidum]